MLKINRSNGKLTERTFVITNQAIYYLEKFDKLKYRVPHGQVTGISCFPGIDGVLILKLEGNKKGDFMMVANTALVREERKKKKKRQRRKGSSLTTRPSPQIEIMTRLFLEIKEVTKKPAKVQVTDRSALPI